MDQSLREKPIAVIGATGHTGRFVLDELERRGLRSILVARDARKLAAAGAVYRASATRTARIDDPASLDRALDGAAAVINCAGPFLDTALPVVEAALRAQISYLDVTAEQPAVRAIVDRDADARRAGVTLLPAAAFFGGLADLLATSAIGAASGIDDISVAVALDSWHPTNGTRLTGARNTARRLIVREGALRPIEDAEPNRFWTFPAPFGDREVTMVPLSETIVLSRHIEAATIESWIDVGALRDVGDATTPPPQPVDERGRSSQTFVMDVVVRAGDRRRRATAFGRDIYAVSAPIVVEAVQRLLASNGADVAGARSLGEIFDARSFLESVGRHDGMRVNYEMLAPQSSRAVVDSARC